MPHGAHDEFDVNFARRGVDMLFLAGDSLLEVLRCVGILQDFPLVEGHHVKNCLVYSEVQKYFAKIRYVFVKPAGHPPHPRCAGFLCTCISYCRYAGCEHVEFTKILNLRLRPATSSAEQLPVQRKRGRKRGQTLTARGESKARCARVKQAPTATSNA